jgi:hypothetical protein
MSLKINTDEVKGKVSAILSEQLPEFIQSDHTTFVAFIEAYYQWLEVEGNAIERTRNVRLYNDIDKTVDAFVSYFKKNYLVDIPDNIINDKRLFLKRVKDFYQSKGTDKSLILLFRMLFNEEVEVYYPKNDMLRVSAGNFTSDIILNIKNLTGDSALLVGQTVVQANKPLQPSVNLATGLIENFVAFAVGDDLIYQLVLTQNSVSGTFVAGEPVSVTTTAGTVTAVIDEIITDVNIDNDGSYYTPSDPLVTKNLTPFIVQEIGGDNILTETGNNIISEDIGDGAQFDITTIGKGGIDRFRIENGGKDYTLKDLLEFSNTGLGTNSIAYVSRIEKQLVLESGESDAILLETGDKILVGDFRRFVAENGTDKILLEDGAEIVPEDADHDGVIQDIRIVDTGTNYNQLPTVAVASSTGSGAVLYAASNDVGRISGVQRTNVGSGYFQSPVVTPRQIAIFSNVNGTFSQGETVTERQGRILAEDGDEVLLEDGSCLLNENSVLSSGTIVSIDTTRSLYNIRPTSETDNFSSHNGRLRVVGAVSGADAVVFDCDPAVISPVTGTVSRSEGVLFGADGRISESSKKIQDSLYYQDFSYVIKVGNSINVWRDAVKRILHPVGLALFGEVSISTSVRARVFGGSDFRLNSAAPRFKQIKLLNEIILQTLVTPHIQKLELEIFFEVAQATLFPTRLMKEDGTYLLAEDSFETLTNKGKNYLRGEEYILGTEPGSSVMPTLTFPRFKTPIANIDATIQLLKQIVLYLKGAGVLQLIAEVPTAPNIPTLGGNQHGKTSETPDITVLIHTFEAYVNQLTLNTTVKHQLEIYKQLSRIASVAQQVVTLYLPTITSAENLKVVTSSKIHLIASLGLEDVMLHESFGSAKLGATGYSIDRFKFLMPPYSDARRVTLETGDDVLLETGDKVIPELLGFRSIDRGGRIYRDDYGSSVMTANYTGTNTLNDNYWDTYANTQIQNLGALVINDLINYPGRKTDFTFDSEIFLRDS